MTHPEKNRLTHYAALALTALFFLTALCIGAAYHNSVEIDSGEYDGYFNIARHILEQHEYRDTYRPPLYSLLTAGGALLLDGDTFGSGKRLSLFWGALLLLYTYKLGTALYDKKTGLIAQMLLMSVFLVFRMAVWVSPDMMLASLFVITLYYAVHYLEKGFGSRSPLWLGLLLALAYLTKYTAIALLPALLFAMLNAGGDKKEKLRRCALFFLAFAVTALPWFIYNASLNGSPFFNNNWRNLAFSLYGNYDYNYLNDNPFDGYLSVIGHNPLKFFKHWLSNMLNFICEDFFGQTGRPFTAALGIAGLCCALRESSLKTKTALIFMLVYLMGTMLMFYRARVMLVFTPLLLIFAAAFMAKELFPAPSLGFKHGRKISLGHLLLTFVLATNLSIFRYDLAGFAENHPTAEVRAARWLQENYRRYEKKMTPAATLPFWRLYLPGTCYLLPDGVGEYGGADYLDKIKKKLNKRRVNFLLVGRGTLRFRPAGLLDLEKTDPAFQAVYEAKEPYPVKIYHVQR